MSTTAPDGAPPAPPVQGWVQMTPCAKCGQAIDPTKAVYSKQGDLVCKSCESNDLIEEGYMRAAKSSCFGALGTGVLSVFFDIYLIFSILAIVQAIRALILIHRPEYRAVLRNRYPGYLLAALGGLVCGMVRPGITVLAIIAAALMH